MNYQQEWADEHDELSEFDLSNSSEPFDDPDPESPVADPPLPDEADPADAVEQLAAVPFDEDDESPA
ncbi:hypothetical protein GCM10009853_065910 [Glycomyces scopariae]|uniref:Uncharacterized protein n=1 Tax=Glycomyces sambucus TaxID=380244 RepID=A0A1G9H631_9ACTN|nr:hypothetical protein [Glycomyces sambucus]SDL08319.1 hypothetical protein SAMN05216298_2641 [Glycomyces sambucus]